MQENLISDPLLDGKKPARFDILKFKHWHLVLLFFVLVIPLDMALMFATRNFRHSWTDGIAAICLYAAYPVLTWRRLDQLLAGEPLFERASKVKVAIAIILIVTIPPIARSYPESPLSYPVAAIFLVALCYLHGLPAKQLKSIELKRNAGIWEYIPDAFLFFMWPSFGVFWLQPRINRILAKKIRIDE